MLTSNKLGLILLEVRVEYCKERGGGGGGVYITCKLAMITRGGVERRLQSALGGVLRMSSVCHYWTGVPPFEGRGRNFQPVSFPARHCGSIDHKPLHVDCELCTVEWRETFQSSVSSINPLLPPL
ncbi:hypothetical protein H6P81_003841 [Aristolochia fimbriata]|uniref:Uncharacterized protein n=1 Tax=Aristolochia fimbriata TaxID=158543 RepID=A0AAV7FHI2_ARIFI|nr:hypothetical protein H6P81_003841 [Aristolochia fimbriata]